MRQRPEDQREANNSVSGKLRILVARRGTYPARSYPVSGEGLASFRITDLLVKGLAELGHEVHYQVNRNHEPLPEGVQLAALDANPAVDIAHRQVDVHERKSGFPQPWVKTCHTDLAGRGLDRSLAEDNWIFVSRTLAGIYGSSRYVLNGIDPSEFIYSATKSDYFLFVGCLDRWEEKGLEIAILLARKAGFRLVVAGSAASHETTEALSQKCRHANIELVGEIHGQRKAELFAGARALLFPTQANEAFGAVMAEALISGTPVICSDRGACPEIVSPDVGFVCSTDQDYLVALDRVRQINPAECRQKALCAYHYLRMAQDYVVEYQQEIAQTRSSSGA
jgi:glycosyltransferase involved in cell wall biosynthesis